jgi:Zn ribbon nucleic-acid-binding protein
MSSKVIVAGVEIEIGWGKDFSVLASYSCPKCNTINQVNLSDYQEDDKISCVSCGGFALDLVDSNFRQVRESIAEFKRMFKG